MIEMRARSISLAFAALLAFGHMPSGHAEDAAAPKAVPAPAPAPAPSAAPTEAPASVPRPSIVPKTAEPASPPAAAEPTPRRHRRYARHHSRRYAYWQPFPIYWPHLRRHGIYWNRIPWMFRF
jgi:uncharacterized membrane protein